MMKLVPMLMIFVLQITWLTKPMTVYVIGIIINSDCNFDGDDLFWL